MSLAYFPLYPADFEADTAHLTLAEDGAYNRLLRLCWRTPGCSIPNDREWIYRRMRCRSDDDRAVVDSVLDEFFRLREGRLSNARLAKEWLAANTAHARRAQAGAKGGKAKSRKTSASIVSNAVALAKQPEPEPDKKEGGGGVAHAHAREAADLRLRLYAAAGIDLSGEASARLFGSDTLWLVQGWQTLGLTDDELASEVAMRSAAKRDGPPKSLKWFDEPIRRLAGLKRAPPPEPITPTVATANGASHEPRTTASRAAAQRRQAVDAAAATFLAERLERDP